MYDHRAQLSVPTSARICSFLRTFTVEQRVVGLSARKMQNAFCASDSPWFFVRHVRVSSLFRSTLHARVFSASSLVLHRVLTHCTRNAGTGDFSGQITTGTPPLVVLLHGLRFTRDGLPRTRRAFYETRFMDLDFLSGAMREIYLNRASRRGTFRIAIVFLPTSVRWILISVAEHCNYFITYLHLRSTCAYLYVHTMCHY